MSDPTELRPARRGMSPRSRGVVVAVGAILMVLVFSIRGIAGVFTDYLWFDSLDAGAVWQRQLGMQIMLATAFGLAFFVFLYANLVMVDRLAPEAGSFEPGHPMERYREVVAPNQRRFRLIISAVFAVIAGAGSAGEWKSWLLFRYGGSFGRKDPLHAVDIGFYVFKLPFLSYLVSWAFATFLVVGTAAVLLHYTTGALRLPGSGPASSGAVKAHLSVLLGLLTLAKAADYLLDRYRLALNDDGFIRGALYTDVEARLPVIQLMLMISLLLVVLLGVNLRRRGWGLPLVTMGIWAVLAVVAGAVYPWAIQQFQVQPSPTKFESPYITDNIEMTRFALGLDDVQEQSFDYQPELTDGQITDNSGTIRNVRLLDPELVPQTFSALESKLDYYRFTDLAVDRYEIDGQLTQVVLGARELNPDGIPRPSWETRHLVYTHGYGIAAAPTNAVNVDGEPDFAVSGVPARVAPGAAALELDRPEIYFGRQGADDRTDYAIVGTTRKERSGENETTYTGDGGVAIDSFVRKAAFSLRFGDIEPLVTDYLTPKSRILYTRDVRDRVATLAPFLQWDSDPYPVVVDGRIVYVVDGYTTSNWVPYADTIDPEGLSPVADLREEPANYIRNSVKAVVDAYDGSVKLYLADELRGGQRDPIIRAYAAAFPELFTSISELPMGLRGHLRYPEDLFTVQTTKWSRYHIEDPGEFFSLSDGWDVAASPPREVSTKQTSQSSSVPISSGSGVSPYYLMMRLPAGTEDEFVLFRPFAPRSEDSTDPKKQLTSFLVAKTGFDDYGQLQLYTMTQGRSDGTDERNRAVQGPLAVHEKIVSDNRVSQELTLLSGSGGGSVADFGNMVIVPVDNGLLYVRPLYVRGEDGSSPRRLRKVITVVGDRIAIGNSLAEALAKLYPTAQVETLEGGGAPAPGGEPGTTPEPPAVAGDTATVISRAVKLLDEADAALREGGVEGLATYEEKTRQASELIRQANEQLAGAGAPGPAGGAGSTTTTTLGG